MASHVNGNSANGNASSFTIGSLPKSSVFTDHLPADPEYPTPKDSHAAPRSDLGPRLVKNALFTYVRPEGTKEPELLAVSPAAMDDLGLAKGAEKDPEFLETLSGNKIITWDAEKPEGIYPWAQCYGGYQFGQWAGQLGDGRAISLFETTNPSTGIRYEIQLKGAGRTPYSRFADGKAVLRSSIREFVVSEFLNTLGIPTTRALALVLAPKAQVRRERIEPGAIVTRFAQSWIRIGTFDLPRSRGDRKLVRQLATYVAEHVFGGWEKLPARFNEDKPSYEDVKTGIPASSIEGEGKDAENRFTRLYRQVCRANARTVAAWQAYGFMNGVLNTDNTSIMGLSIDFGPFGFLDTFDPSYTPNHDDHMLRYSYRNQPTIIWWNLVRLGESLGELIGAGAKCDDQEFIEEGVRQEIAEDLVARAENLIEKAGEEYKGVFMAEYKRLMTRRFGLKTFKDSDFDDLYSEWLDTLEAYELDFNRSFRELSYLALAQLDTEDERKNVVERFFHPDQVEQGKVTDAAKERFSKWFQRWTARLREDWGEDDAARQTQMLNTNPKVSLQDPRSIVHYINQMQFIPRTWLLDEVIERTERNGDRDMLPGVMKMALAPFKESWDWDTDTERRFCGPVPKYRGMIQCSCSS
jgi:serine/tyrosine/threonine adenylyltransferase